MSAIEPSYRYIVRTPGVRGGQAHVEGTRIGVHDVIGLLQNGETVDSLITNCFPDLTRAQVYDAWRTTRTIGVKSTSWSPGRCRPASRELPLRS